MFKYLKIALLCGAEKCVRKGFLFSEWQRGIKLEVYGIYNISDNGACRWKSITGCVASAYAQ